MGGRPVPELAGLAFGLRFFKQKIQFARRCVLIHLPGPLLVVTAVDPGHQPVEISRGQLLSGTFDLFHRAHAAKIPARRCPGNPQLQETTSRASTGNRRISPSSPAPLYHYVSSLTKSNGTPNRGPAYGHEQEFRQQQAGVPVKNWGYKIWMGLVAGLIGCSFALYH